jgi:spore maturation protein CgeB
MRTLKKDINLLIVGAFPDRLNNNASLRKYVAEGFISILGEKCVLECQLESVSETISRFLPNLILCFGSCMPDVSSYRELRKSCDKYNIPLVFWLHDDPYEFDYSYKVESIADWIFSNDKWAALHYSHPKTYHLPLGASPTHHFKKWDQSKVNDVFFCGVGFSNRQNLIRDISKTLATLNTKIVGDNWSKNLQSAQNKRLTNKELSTEYSKSRITLNIGRHLNLANNRYQLAPSSPGPRTFEAAMAGTVQFYFVESLEIIEYFTPEKEIILFNDPRDFNLRLEEVLEDQKLAKRIAIASQKRALKNHSYLARAEALLTKCGFL